MYAINVKPKARACLSRTLLLDPADADRFRVINASGRHGEGKTFEEYQAALDHLFALVSQSLAHGASLEIRMNGGA